MKDPFPVGAALKVLRMRQQLTQTAASKLDGAPDFRTLSHWETRRKMPSLRLLYCYLQTLGFDLSDLQLALDLLTERAGEVHQSLAQRLSDVERRLNELEQECRSAPEDPP